MKDEQGAEPKAPSVPAIAGAVQKEPEVKEPEAKEVRKAIEKVKAEPKVVEEVKKEIEKPKEEKGITTHIFALRTTANREDQVMDFVVSNIKKKKLAVFSVIRPHGMRGYIFVEALDRQVAEESGFNVPYARGILPKEIGYNEIEHMLEQVKRDVDIRKRDVVEIITGPFKREQARVTRIDKTKEEVVVELLGAAVPIPITVKMDAVKVIRREAEEKAEE